MEWSLHINITFQKPYFGGISKETGGKSKNVQHQCIPKAILRHRFQICEANYL
jgi:hypothetical protein